MRRLRRKSPNKFIFVSNFMRHLVNEPTSIYFGSIIYLGDDFLGSSFKLSSNFALGTGGVDVTCFLRPAHNEVLHVDHCPAFVSDVQLASLAKQLFLIKWYARHALKVYITLYHSNKLSILKNDWIIALGS